MTLGQMVIGTEFSELHAGGELRFRASQPMAAAGPLRQFLVGRDIQSAHIVTVAHLHKKTGLRFGLEQGLGAIDMESTRWARLCIEHDTPFLCLRSVSDLLHQDIDYDLEPLMDRHGRLQPWKAVQAMLGHPDWIPQFHASWKRARIASASLAKTLRSLLSLPASDLRAIFHDLGSTARLL